MMLQLSEQASVKFHQVPLYTVAQLEVKEGWLCCAVMGRGGVGLCSELEVKQGWLCCAVMEWGGSVWRARGEGRLGVLCIDGAGWGLSLWCRTVHPGTGTGSSDP